MEKEQIRKIVIDNAEEEAQKILEAARQYISKVQEEAKSRLNRIKEQEEARFRYWEQLERSREIGKALQIEKDYILTAKHRVIEDIVKKFQEDYRNLSKDPEKYRSILKNLLVEAFNEVKGGELVVYTSEKDRSILEKILKEEGIKAQLETKKEDFDGVIIEDRKRGFLVYNTIENRLERAREILLEEFSKILLGE